LRISSIQFTINAVIQNKGRERQTWPTGSDLMFGPQTVGETQTAGAIRIDVWSIDGPGSGVGRAFLSRLSAVKAIAGRWRDVLENSGARVSAAVQSENVVSFEHGGSPRAAP
jgi:hypothetical protein